MNTFMLKLFLLGLGIAGWGLVLRSLYVIVRRMRSYDRRKALRHRFLRRKNVDEGWAILDAYRQECAKYGNYDGSYPER
jgi:hypothetical protein